MRRVLPFVVLLSSLLSAACSASYKASYAESAAMPAPPPAQGVALEEERAGYPALDGAVESPGEANSALFAKEAPAPSAPAGTDAGGAPSPQSLGSTSAAVASAESRRAPILIYRADFTMSVFEVPRALDRVEKLAVDAGGYLAKRDDRSITVRVPVASFSATVTALEKEGDVLSRNVRTDDVTAEFRDLEVQLQNLRAMRARFEKLLEMATKVEDALQVERELGRITGEIERIRGRLKLLGDLAQFSTITVRFEPRTTQSIQEGPFVLPLPWLGDLGLRRLMSL
jgi:hypothetical protein